MRLRDVHVLGTMRTPFGKFLGSLKNIPAPKLGARAICGLFEKAGINPDMADSVIMGEALTAGVGQNPARQAAIFAGVTIKSSAITVNKVCASSLAAIQLAVQMIRTGEAECVIAGGMESMSRAPFLLPRLENESGDTFKSAVDIVEPKIVTDSMIFDGLRDAYETDTHMGVLADRCAKILGISREDQEEYALQSIKAAFIARDAGLLNSQIATVSGGLDKDECFREPDEAKMKSLKPAFAENGTITAATSSQIADGASAMLLVSDAVLHRLKIKSLAKVVADVTHSHTTEWYPTAPVGAIDKLLKKVSLTINDIDLFEINEAFAVVPILTIRALNIPREKVNIWGGAISFGHPLGASGARIAGNIVCQLLRNNLRYGIAVACNGGGEAVAVLIERAL